MKKISFFKSMLMTMAIIACLANIRIASGQDVKGQSVPIPDNINKIFQTSCTPCHWANGKKMAMSMVNFSKWAEYDSEKGPKKASMICYVLTKGKMPPKSARKSFPELIPTKEQIDMICKWSESLKAK